MLAAYNALPSFSTHSTALYYVQNKPKPSPLSEHVVHESSGEGEKADAPKTDSPSGTSLDTHKENIAPSQRHKSTSNTAMSQHFETEEALKAHLIETNPMLHGLTRFIGYLDEIYEASIGTLASGMSFYNRGILKATPEKIKQAMVGKTVQGLDMESNYAGYVDKLFPSQLKLLSFLNTAVYALSNVYCMGDSAVTGYRGYKQLKKQAQAQKMQHAEEGTAKAHEKTDKNLERRAVAKGVQLTFGQYVFHYLASYTLPPLVIRDIVYKNIKWLGDTALKSAPPAIKQKASTIDTVISMSATLASVASMPVVAKYLDPMCEKFAEECFYRPTNKLLDVWLPTGKRTAQPQAHPKEKEDVSEKPHAQTKAHDESKIHFQGEPSSMLMKTLATSLTPQT
jgi:hypothetical protein